MKITSNGIRPTMEDELENFKAVVAGNIEGNTGGEYGADKYGRNGTKRAPAL